VGKGIYRILDSSGIKNNFIIDNLYYCPTVPVRVLSPQHLDAMWRKRNSDNRFSVMVNSEGCLMTWTKSGKTYHKYAKIHHGSVVPIFKSAQGYENAVNYLATIGDIFDDYQCKCCASLTTIPDDEIVTQLPSDIETIRTLLPKDLTVSEGRNTTTNFDCDKPMMFEFGDEDNKVE
jgi:hypothetical protein